MKKIEDYPYEVRERAAILEYEAGFVREDAERRAIRDWISANPPALSGAEQMEFF